MNNELDSREEHDKVVELVKEAKKRPLPRSSKVLFVVLVFGLVFTGGIAYGKHNATASAGGGLSLSSLGAGNFAALGGGGFGGGRLRNNGGAGAGTSAGAGAGTFDPGGAGAGAATTVADVAGTVVSITAKEIVITTISGDKQTFPITDTTKIRASTLLDLSKVKSGDIVTIKPDDANAAKTIMVVK